MVPEKTQNSKTIYITSKTHNSTKTLRNDYNRLLQHRCSYLQPIWSLTCHYRIQESNRGVLGRNFNKSTSYRKRVGKPKKFTTWVVDWPACQRASLKLGPFQKITTLKLEFDFLATMKRRKKYEPKINGRCPHCGRFNEDFNHVVRCPHNIEE